MCRRRPTRRRGRGRQTPEVAARPAEAPGETAAKPPSTSRKSDTINLGSITEREAKLGGHNISQTGVRKIVGRERDPAGAEPVGEMTFETQLK
jgi:hypothetical protein